MSQDAVVVDGFDLLHGWDGPAAKNYLPFQHITIESSMAHNPFFLFFHSSTDRLQAWYGQD